jgi:hypothetical protein
LLKLEMVGCAGATVSCVTVTAKPLETLPALSTAKIVPPGAAKVTVDAGDIPLELVEYPATNEVLSLEFGVNVTPAPVR